VRGGASSPFLPFWFSTVTPYKDPEP